MESGQCLEGLPGATITKDLCIPPMTLVSRHLGNLARKTRIYNVFVASDVTGEKHGLDKLLGKRVSVFDGTHQAYFL